MALLPKLCCYLLAYGTHKNPLFGLKAIFRKCIRQSCTHNSVCCAVGCIDESLPSYSKYKLPLSGLKAMHIGPFPTGMRLTTVFVYRRLRRLCNCQCLSVYIAVVLVKGILCGLTVYAGWITSFSFPLTLKQSLQLITSG